MSSTITVRQYRGDRTANGDYQRVHDFLVRTGNSEYTYARFDWMMTNWEYLEAQYLGRVGIWEETEEIVAVTLFDHSLDCIFPIVLKGYETLYPEMIRYARTYMIKEEEPDFWIYASDQDEALKRVLLENGFIASEWHDLVARFDFDRDIPGVNLPEGYQFTSLAENPEYEKYMFCLFRGFGHEEEGKTFHFDETELEELKQAFGKPTIDKRLKVSVVGPDGEYAAHCGMWYDPAGELALIEPVCVVPDARKMGLGREVVCEGLRRAKALGASYAVVGSGMQFYYNLGMIPFRSGTMWKERKRQLEE